MTDRLLRQAYTELALTMEQIATIVKVAEVIAVIDNSKAIKPEHIAEAISYRFPNN